MYQVELNQVESKDGSV